MHRTRREVSARARTPGGCRQPANEGFLRPDAFLAIVAMTNEDDCSAPPDSDLFEKKTELLRLLDLSSRANGVQIFIGGESSLVPHEDMAVITAPYEVDGKIVESPDRTRLWRYHKPDGLVTTHSDPQGRPTIQQLIGQAKAGVSHVSADGRTTYALIFLAALAGCAVLVTVAHRAAPQLAERVPP